MTRTIWVCKDGWRHSANSLAIPYGIVTPAADKSATRMADKSRMVLEWYLNYLELCSKYSRNSSEWYAKLLELC